MAWLAVGGGILAGEKPSATIIRQFHLYVVIVVTVINFG